jgi:hypothetical protein
MKALGGALHSCKAVWGSVPQLWRYAFVGSLSLALSFGGVIWAASAHRVSEGGRGGAIATMVAIFIVLLRPDYGQKILDDRMATINPELSPIDRLDQEVKAIVSAMRINSKGQTRLNRGLVIASAIGTIFWGFGDIFAKWLTCFF